MKVHGVRHGRFVDELHPHSLSWLDSQLRLLAAWIIHVKCVAIDEPFIAAHVALQAQDRNLIGNFVLQRFRGGELAFQS